MLDLSQGARQLVPRLIPHGGGYPLRRHAAVAVTLGVAPACCQSTRTALTSSSRQSRMEKLPTSFIIATDKTKGLQNFPAPGSETPDGRARFAVHHAKSHFLRAFV